MKYEFIEINNFIVANGSDEHYEADLKLYRKIFPDSGILKDLENPFPPKKKELDERMLFEILNADRVCMETIMENRGIIVSQEKGKEIVMPYTAEPYIKQLMDADIETLKYNELKALVFGLKLTVSDQKTDTLRVALSIFKADISPSPILPLSPSQDNELPEGEKKS